MPLADLARSRVPTATAPEPVRLRGWGGGAGALAWLVRSDRPEAMGAALEAFRTAQGVWPGVLARGMGRSYGDAAQLAGGLVLDTTRLGGSELDAPEGTVTAGAGVTLGALLARLVPIGWMVPVVPGTQHVSVGGAIAGDIHGKNHGSAGTFGRHVAELGLLMSSGEELSVKPGEPLYDATVGGMGLTGVILWARIRLAPVSSPFLSVDTDRVGNLDDALAALRAPGGPLRVAWLDLLAPGRAQRGQRAVEVADAIGVDGQKRAAHRRQADARPQDDAGQSHATEGGVEEWIAGGQQQFLAG